MKDQLEPTTPLSTTLQLNPKVQWNRNIYTIHKHLYACALHFLPPKKNNNNQNIIQLKKMYALHKKQLVTRVTVSDWQVMFPVRLLTTTNVTWGGIYHSIRSRQQLFI